VIVKIVHAETLISSGSFPRSKYWEKVRRALHRQIRCVEHPVGNGSSTIFPESGKRRGEGNGVTPIKEGLMAALQAQGWLTEQPLDIATRQRPGKVDAVLLSSQGNIALEWETGNISSSHRALNKLCLGLLKGKISAGILIVPSRALYQYLTDRVGNFDELLPYFDLWRSVDCDNGVLEVVVIEHDNESRRVSRIPKGTDGRSRS
jgi:hypothetical protein